MFELPDSHIQKLITESIFLTKDGIGIFDKNDKLIFCNDAMAVLFGSTPPDVLNQTFTDLCFRCFNSSIGINIESESFDVWISNALAKRRSSLFRTFETDIQNGRFFLVTEQIVQEDYLYTYFTDITKQKDNELALKEMSCQLKKVTDKDYLTGIYSRRYFYEHANAEFSRSKRTSQALSILLFDLDSFKQVNDKYGHAAGDAVLKSFSANVHSLLRTYDIFSRIGGEEFALLLPETKANEAYLISERIRKLVSSLEIPFEQERLKITASMGLIESAEHITEFDQMMRLADEKLYQAKLNGKNQTCYK